MKNNIQKGIYALGYSLFMAYPISFNEEPAPLERLIHDLSIPLSIIKLNLDLLQKGNDPTYLRRINIGWEKMDMILKQRRSVRLIKSNYYFSNMIDEIFDLFGTSLNELGIDLIKDYEVDISIGVYQDKLLRILINIFNNALESLRQYGGKRQIRVKTSIKARYFRISIYNNGKGFPADVLDKLGHCPLQGRARGRGKGLYNCALLLRRYFKGRIIFHNPAQGGAQVLILIPQYILGNGWS